MKKVLIKVITAISLLLFFYMLNSSNQIKFVVKDIQMNFNGVIVDKYTVREGVYPTFLKVRTDNDIIDISPSFKILYFAEIGDSIIKVKDENICYIINKNGVRKTFFYVTISKSQRDDKNFPQEWKNKWMGATTLLDSIYDRSRF